MGKSFFSSCHYIAVELQFYLGVLNACRTNFLAEILINNVTFVKLNLCIIHFAAFVG